jgi:hypothetical protein
MARFARNAQQRHHGEFSLPQRLAGEIHHLIPDT